ncbi:hypothetical protein ACFW04_009359 [Cataglyphis niger]
MGVPDVEQAKRRLQDILRRAQKLEIPTQEVISTRTARKLLARTRNILAWTIWIGVFVVLLSGVVYARWPTRQDVETVRTVLRRTVNIPFFLVKPILAFDKYSSTEKFTEIGDLLSCIPMNSH